MDNLYETSHPYTDFAAKGTTVLYYLRKDKNTPEGGDFYYENDRLYKKPKKIKNDEKGNIRFCFCFRKKRPVANILKETKEKKKELPDEQKAQSLDGITVVEEDEKGCRLI